MLYVMSYTQQWHFIPFPKRMRSSNVWCWVGGLMSCVLVAAFIAMVTYSVISAVKELSLLQSGRS